jgi:hypothetical protein
MKTTEKKAQKAPKRTNVDSVSQSELARLIGLPASYIRSNSHLFVRDENGRYSGPQAVKALMDQRPVEKAEPLEFDDATLELFLQSTFSAAIDWHYRSATVKKLDALIEQHGDTAALAAFGAVMLQAIRDELDRQGDEHYSQRVNGDRESLELEAAEWVEGELKKAREYSTRRAGRVVDVCADCKTYRFGRTRRPLPVPPGYIGDEDPGFYCDQCDAKRILSR